VTFHNNNNNNSNNNNNVAIPSDRNVLQKESEKKLKYKNLSIEIQRMWNMKCFVIPVIIGTAGIVTRGLKNIWNRFQESIQYILYKKTAGLERRRSRGSSVSIVSDCELDDRGSIPDRSRGFFF
jgi:hypothetical protein